MRLFLLSVVLMSLSFYCSSKNSKEITQNETVQHKEIQHLAKYKKAYFASGCFWCVESVFESVNGVKEVISGYAGGNESSASYKKVSTGVTEHAEAVEVYYDPEIIDYKTLLVVFFDSHDPTTLNRQGPDYGRQYRSMILYQTEEEKKLAFAKIDEINESGQYKDKVVTEVVPFSAFYPAEEYHQDYKKRNPDNSYVKSVSIPRLKKFQSKHPVLLKKEK
ncbi:MAG: peptide-methionine (S)-S-oxide reductase MsrA [Saprospiraceae bacterium]|nr:peptide-methionine (S)-S-oxide reductase MsrA [Saprospiraceae bacterium]MBK8080531.1 peptide-methionine (S)-S-oxide reductase MsrA [Saprospiraceae bacterium]MBK9043547.1 peptide-methionine (S)-S-oxide reductase MsrA [Saprospiraceae bacterium]